MITLIHKNNNNSLIKSKLEDLKLQETKHTIVSVYQLAWIHICHLWMFSKHEEWTISYDTGDSLHLTNCHKRDGTVIFSGLHGLVRLLVETYRLYNGVQGQRI